MDKPRKTFGGEEIYLVNGHNWPRDNLPCYLPENGGLLYPIALMAASLARGEKRSAPGFPSDGSWQVRAEGFDERLMRTLWIPETTMN